MPALNFTVFLDKVADSSKPHTIRARRKRPIKAGDRLYFYTGMRTRKCRALRRPCPCSGAATITINARKGTVRLGRGSIYYRAGRLTRKEILDLSWRDGFAHVDDFFDFFAVKGGGNFVGQLIEWRPWRPSSP